MRPPPPLAWLTGNPDQEAVAAERAELLQCTALLPWGRWQCNSRNTLPHDLGAEGSATPAMRGPTSLGGHGVLPGRRWLPK